MTYVEQRAYARFNYVTPITYEYFNTNNCFGAVMHNHGMGGMCFETNYAIPKGVEIYIKMTNYSPEAPPPESREGYRAEVRWCQARKEGDPSTYRIGVNYFEPVLL